MSKPWVARLGYITLFFVVMLGAWAVLPALSEGGGIWRVLIVDAIVFPCLFAFTRWINRKLH